MPRELRWLSRGAQASLWSRDERVRFGGGERERERERDRGREKYRVDVASRMRKACGADLRAEQRQLGTTTHSVSYAGSGEDGGSCGAVHAGGCSVGGRQEWG